jgi:hypothetical protein
MGGRGCRGKQGLRAGAEERVTLAGCAQPDGQESGPRVARPRQLSGVSPFMSFASTVAPASSKRWIASSLPDRHGLRPRLSRSGTRKVANGREKQRR